MGLEGRSAPAGDRGMKRMRLLAVAAVLAAAGGQTPSAAQEASLFCLNAGNRYQVGDYACLPGCHGRQRYARCDAVAQNASWTYISDVCPIALFAPLPPADATAMPAATAMSPIAFEITSCAIDPALAAPPPG